MNKSHILLFLSHHNIEIIESILKNYDYPYEFLTKNDKIKSNILIVDYICIEEKKDLDLSNFKKIICIIPSGYRNFITEEIKLDNMIFVELPITYNKLVQEIIK